MPRYVNLHLLNKLFILAIVLNCSLSPICCTVITSVSYVFEAFSPYSMIRFFEFSDKGWNISENCLKDMYNYLEGLRTGKLWAVKLYDATSYYGGAAFGPSNLRINNPNLCRDLYEDYKRKGVTSWSNPFKNGSVVPFPVHIVLGQYLIEIVDETSFKTEKIQQLICFPQSCTNGDLLEILQVYLFQSNSVVRNNTFLKHRILTENYSILHDFDFYILISFISSAILLYIVVHVFENYIPTFGSCNDTKNMDTKSQSSFENVLSLFADFKKQFNAKRQIVLENEAATNLYRNNVDFLNSNKNPQAESQLPRIVSSPKKFYMQELIDALSIPNAIYGIIQKEANEAACANTGLFILFSILLVYANLTAELHFLAGNSPTTETRTFLQLSSTYLFDIYFFICGSRLVQQFFKTLPQEKFNVFDQLMHILTLMLRKLFTLMPSYTFALFVERVLAKYLHYNIALEIPSHDINTCKMNIWSNILYVDTFFPLTDRCMPWTWFISLEIQFFIIATIVLLLAEIHPRYAVVIGTTLFIISVLAAAFVELQPNTPHYFGKIQFVEILQFNLVFDNICLRIAPYLMGICLGYILHKTDYRMELHLVVIICGWIACIFTMTFFLYSDNFPLFSSDPFLHAVVLTLEHTMWSMILFWIVLASITQYGGFLLKILDFKYSHSLAKLSPITFLIGPIIIRLFIFTADMPIHSSEGHIFLIGLGCLLIIYTCALPLYILYDGPLSAVLDVIMRRK